MTDTRCNWTFTELGQCTLNLDHAGSHIYPLSIPADEPQRSPEPSEPAGPLPSGPGLPMPAPGPAQPNQAPDQIPVGVLWDDSHVERAARALWYEDKEPNSGDPDVLEWDDMAGVDLVRAVIWRADARRVLEAAFGPSQLVSTDGVYRAAADVVIDGHVIHAGDRLRLVDQVPDRAARLIALDDVDAVDALPLDAVLLCRVGEVFQVKHVPTLQGPARAWFALGYGQRLWTPEEVASWGPLRVLYDPSVDLADGVIFCSACMGTGQDLDAGRSGSFALAAPQCLECGGTGYWDTTATPPRPIHLTEAL